MPDSRAVDVVDLYLRKSTKDEGRSVERQLGELTDAAESEDLTIGRVFVDPDFSASRHRRRERPDFAALVEYIRSGACRVLGLFEVSRGSRDAAEWFAFLDLCRARGVRIWVSTHERVYDLSRRRDWRALADEGVDAADESEKIRERVLSGKRKAAREGKPSGRLQYGFTRLYDEKGRFVRQEAHPEQAPVVREMVRRITEGESLTAIARDLNERSLTMPGGAPWAGRFVRQMVLRPSYAGRIVHQGQDVGPASWEPIVDVDQWRKAVALLTRPERRTTTRGTELAHWLTNAVACGTCRTTKLRARTGGTKRPRVTYQCDGCGMVVSAVALEDFVEKVLLARLGRPDAAALLTRRTDDAATAAAEKELADLRGELEEWKALAKARKVSPASFAEFEADLLPQIERAEEKLRRLTVPPENADLSMSGVPARWPDLPAELKRRYVRALVDLMVHPAARRGPVFDPARLGASRWTGDALTWAEHWEAEGLAA
ncbi:recombinase family protein [Micromonospora peucetia]|uniref:Site-specific DNA recombinase n=1 Tax=Micromonospora peucetia TaxID=47871 RepID=A0A1C6V411_9ACTN|nr:recombinase family protein [Micromonospora peucetia]SCL61081.1 Site-specific DNA recombinase [Micromonospora peucetia]